MSVITSITAQKNKKRVNVFLDNIYSFSIDLDNLVKLNLKVNQELTQDEINEIIKKSELSKCFEKTLRFAMARPRSLKEVKDYFRRKEIGKSIHQTIIDKLVRLELLDDQKFAKWWVDQRLAFKLKSEKDITFELRQKGIDTNIIKNVLNDKEIDEVNIAKELVSKKMYKWQKYDEKVRKQKISQYLIGKGFGWDIVNSIIDINLD